VGGALVAPAPLDLHFHGAGGHVVPPGGALDAIDTTLRRVVSDAGWIDAGGRPCAYDWLATLPIPAIPPHDPLEHVAACARAIGEAGPTSGCRGIRIEGLFLNPQRAGVWPPETFRAPDLGLVDELAAAARDGGSQLRIIDVAPELPGAIELVEHLCSIGVVASLAHTDATWEQARAAIDAGASLATHTWNAMRQVTHRDPGVVAAVLADPRVTCELICDGVHLHPGTVALSIAACGSGGWIAVSDASPFAGAACGEYDWAGTTVTHDGSSLRDHAGRLAGSASLLDAAFRQLGELGTSIVERMLALGADPRRVLDPARSRGLHVGDPVWIIDEPRA
jgi:N-acetylglucosamine-6-phosphate deacetylase